MKDRVELAHQRVCEFIKNNSDDAEDELFLALFGSQDPLPRTVMSLARSTARDVTRDSESILGAVEAVFGSTATHKEYLSLEHWRVFRGLLR